ncbi:MAG: amino acid adenylation domain-containing protein [Planctomycetes bacterium]|nr:amino acid adenylation domain-containing protein [Planctomycetota bacterium]
MTVRPPGAADAKVRIAWSNQPAIPLDGSRDHLPTTAGQRRLWLLDQIISNPEVYNVYFLLRLRGRVNALALQRSLATVVARHAALRTRLVNVEGILSQLVEPPSSVESPVIDLRAHPASERFEDVRERVHTDSKRRFDLASGNLWTVQLYLLEEEESLLWVNFHHSIMDGWAVSIFFRELSQCYEAFCVGREPSLSILPIQFGDFAAWQREYAKTPEFQHQLEGWKTRLNLPLPPLDLPVSKTRPTSQTFLGATHKFAFPSELVVAIDELARRELASRFLVGLAAFQSIMHRYTRQEDLLIGVPVANRQRPETREIIGFFTNTLVFRTNLGGNPTFRNLLARTRRTRDEAFTGSDIDLESLVEAIQPAHDPSRQPFFQVVFQYQNIAITPDRIGSHTAEVVPVHNGTAMFDLRMVLEDSSDGGLWGWIEFNTALFDSPVIERLANHYLTFLQAACTEPDKTIGELPLLTLSEREQLVIGWNNTLGQYPMDLCIHQLFEEQVRRQPDAVAVIANGRKWTFRQLNEKANQLARHLQSQGVGPGTFVGVCLKRSPEMMTAILAVLKGGSAYVPLDSVYPRDRLAFMLGDTKAAVVLTEQSLIERLPEGAAQYLCLDLIGTELDRLDTENLGPVSTPDDRCYVIYTSGSTGRPKGVVLRHRAVVNTLDWVNTTFGVGPSDRVLFVTSLSFDLSVYDIFGVLGAGGSVRVADEEELRDPVELMRILRTEPITIWDSAPAALQQLAPFFAQDRGGQLRLVMLSGDWIPVSLPNLVRAAFPQSKVMSLGGATEAAIWSNWYPIGHVDPSWPSIPYGKPIRNARYHILDDRLQPVPVGVPGELHIGGLVLADGYLNRPELTAERFIPDHLTPTSPPELGLPNAPRLYKTGDLARYFPDGNIEFLGRIDQQVKVRGYRVELGEIETVLAQHPAVREVVVKNHRDDAGHVYLVAYLVLRPSLALNSAELAKYLKAKLPEYMVPSQFMVLESLPLTPNGKLDRAALTPPELVVTKSETEFKLPTNDAERALQAIWEEVLKVRPISVTDSFYDLGGHSLMAAVLMARVESQLGHRLPLELLFSTPTVRGLATLIQRKLELGRGCLVPLQTEGIKPALFLIAGAGGHVFAFHQFARLLGSDQPTYGLKAVGVDGSEHPLESMKEIASRYLKEILHSRPNGPFIIGGYSIGAIIAFELALQLRAAGMEVPRVIVFDMLAPGYPRKPALPRRTWSHLVRFVMSRGKIAYLKDRYRRLRGRVLGLLNLHRLDAPGVPGMDVVPQENLKRVWGALTKAHEHYWPSGMYDGRVVLFASNTPEDWPGCVFDDDAKGWSRWTTGGVEIHTVHAGHLEMFHESNQRVIAALLREAIAKIGK